MVLLKNIKLGKNGLLDLCHGLINNGNSGIEGINENELSSLISSRKIDVTSEYSTLKDVEIIIVCVPTPLDKKHEPDLGYVIDAATKLSLYVKRGTLIIFESTVSPGTTRDILAPLITCFFTRED